MKPLPKIRKMNPQERGELDGDLDTIGGLGGHHALHNPVNRHLPGGTLRGHRPLKPSTRYMWLKYVVFERGTKHSTTFPQQGVGA